MGPEELNETNVVQTLIFDLVRSVIYQSFPYEHGLYPILILFLSPLQLRDKDIRAPVSEQRRRSELILLLDIFA
jgi:hypothetical protein